MVCPLGNEYHSLLKAATSVYDFLAGREKTAESTVSIMPQREVGNEYPGNSNIISFHGLQKGE
jgi:hypothetical protein